MKEVRLNAPGQTTLVSGVAGAAVPAVLLSLLAKESAPLAVVICRNLGQAEAWAEDLAFLSASFDGRLAGTVLLPEVASDSQDDARAFDLQLDRLHALTRMADHMEAGDVAGTLCVFATPRGFFMPAPPREALQRQEVHLRAGQPFRFQELVDLLGTRLGYDHEAVCETPGQFAVRGGLIDIYPMNANAPVRVDFFGDEIDAIRSFDPTTQRTLEDLRQVTLASLGGDPTALKERHILDYIGRRAAWFFHEPVSLAAENQDLFNQFERSAVGKTTFQDLFDERSRCPDRWFGLGAFEEAEDLFGQESRLLPVVAEAVEDLRPPVVEEALGVDRVNAEEAARRALLEEVLRWQREGWRLVAVSASEGDEARLKVLLEQAEGLHGLEFAWMRGPLRGGFRLSGLEWPGGSGGAGVAFVTSNDIFGRHRPRPPGLRRRLLPRKSQVDQALDFAELAPGDPLVHLSHGICLYRGLTKIEGKTGTEEVISLEFAEGLLLHLPLHESHLLTRYVGLTKRAPKLGKLGTNTWEKTRGAAEKATVDFAATLLRVQAQRNTAGGYQFSPDGDWQRAFEATFPWEETRDQHKAIEDAKRDMQEPRAMDRLICGDVGFGKTEVALRAAFKAVMDGKQVAVLVPTTVLAQQHFNTFAERMAEFPVTVEMLSRFRTAQQQDEVLRQLRSGGIDIVIGTHRLLSKDVRFADLGLLVIDEEHRFGVRHKERIKHLRQDVDVLTMSATPIPRTLYMALMGARDLSVIETAPVDRLPIQTFVKSYSPDLVRDAIRYELDRGGQVFYLHNRVDSIEGVAARLREALPGARIGVGHGQMDEETLERVMTAFVAGDYDVLVCTTIIESGLDIPNCNTIIIEGADRFGLAQLYQLRGRVGRFKRQAYAYLLLHRHSQMLDQARKRLNAMRQYTQLGAGFRIAMRDLELRGAGNLLGAQQSGHIAGVGFDLYCQLLRQSIARLKGDKAAALVRATVRLDFVHVGEQALAMAGDGQGNGRSVEPGFRVLREEEREGTRIQPIVAHLPASYIAEAQLRIEFYRELAMCATPREVDEVAAALQDRFGKPPPSVEALVRITEIRTLAEQAGISLVETEGTVLRCLRASGRRDDYVKVGNRFPRLTTYKAIPRLREIHSFLKRYSP